MSEIEELSLNSLNKHLKPKTVNKVGLYIRISYVLIVLFALVVIWWEIGFIRIEYWGAPFDLHFNQTRMRILLGLYLLSLVNLLNYFLIVKEVNP